MAQPILTLTTDFGLADHYVGAMKGVILGICPRAHIVDISHEVTPFAVAEGGYLVAQAYACFPRKTVHIAVVDPGVGSDRRAILVEAAGQYFAGPDNGIFSMVMAREAHKVRLISNPRLFRHPVSRTFHGRDIFAPVAAHLAAGIAPARIGKLTLDAAATDFAEPQVLHIDRFGNIVTSLRASELRDRQVSIQIGRTHVSELASHYAEIEPGRLFLIEGSSGFLEVSMNRGSAAARIECQPGTQISLRPVRAPRARARP
jgi:S-adenosyl-L-methionine hydrolase (adenosine-forming)